MGKNLPAAAFFVVFRHYRTLIFYKIHGFLGAYDSILWYNKYV